MKQNEEEDKLVANLSSAEIATKVKSVAVRLAFKIEL